MSESNNVNLYQLLSSRFPQDLSATVIETPQGQCWSYRDLDNETARIARFLYSIGVRKGDRVAAQVSKSPQALFLYLACLRGGFIYLPLNPAYQEQELDFFLADAQPRVVVCNPQNYETLRKLGNRHGAAAIHTLDEQGQGSLMTDSTGCEPQFPTAICAKDDLAAILYTSGTTGRPKGAMISHTNLAANGLALHSAWGWQDGDVLLHALPIFHVHGLFVASHCALLNGSKILFLPNFDTTQVIQWLPQATVFMGVPTYYTRLLTDPSFDAHACRHMRLFVSGSAPLLEQTFDDFQERTGHTILERYGMTETGMNTSNPLDGPRIASTVGPPLLGVSARIVDNDGAPVEPGTVGQLQVKGDNVFKGYWRLPEKTAEEFTADSYFKTGDLASLDSQGYISIIGRDKDLIISGGLNVYPKEVERCIDGLEGIQESAVIGLPDPDFGEAVTVVVVKQAGYEEVTEETIIQTLKKTIAGFKVPKQVYFVDALPRNAMGKVQKNRLRQHYGA